MILKKIRLFLSLIVIFLMVEFLLMFFGFKFSINISPSLPYKFFIVDKRKQKIENIENGDFIQFINKNTSYYNGVQITKQILAKEGDVLEIHIFDKPENNIQALIKFKNTVLKVKDKSMLGTKIYLNNITIIPKDQYFVIGYDKNSFDSRYKEFGLINKEEIIGVAKPIF